MYVLGIDTATNSGGVALSRNGEVLGVLMVKSPLRYSELIIDSVAFLLAQHRLKLSDIDCFAVTSGPGSFTGIRIGLATVKAFGQSLNRPVVPVPTLEALAYRYRHVFSRVAPMIDARRQQVYAAVYSVQGSRTSEVMAATVAPPAEWLKKLEPERHLFVGDGAHLFKNTVRALRPSCWLIETDNCLLDGLCRLAFQRFTEGEGRRASEVRARYVRPPDARRPVPNPNPDPGRP